jgi:spermidine synthase
LSMMLGSAVNSWPQTVISVLVGASLVAVLVSPPLRTYETLCNPLNVCSGAPFSRVIENRHGVIAVGYDNRGVIGGGVYDGRFNIDPLRDDNGIKRLYSLFGFLSRTPRHVLMIGLSTGSWAQVLANHPEVQDLTIVEINPGYLELIPDHAEVASILRNPKVKIVIDDGHRWLLRNPQAKFDLVIMNTTYHWRANATNLMSRDFLELLKGHMLPGAAHFYNTTESPEAQFTAVSVFPYAVRIANFIAVSDAPLRFHPDVWKELMNGYRIDHAPVIDPKRDNRAFFDTVTEDAQRAMNAPRPDGKPDYFELEDSLRLRWAGRTVVTDDNMAVEWHRWEP